MAVAPPPVTSKGSPTAGTPVIPSPHLLARIRSEYLEMPGLRLTLLQARRLWGLDVLTCASALAVLESAGFLQTTRDGAYVLSNAQRLSA
jgi:hypothetical protein